VSTSLYLVDYHLHTPLCGHARGEIDDYLVEAVKKGLVEIGFCDHLPLYFLPPGQSIPGYAMDEDQLPLYVEKVLALRERSPIPVKLGIEADYAPGRERELALLLSGYPFDYVTGSIHFIDGWSFDHPGEIGEYSRRDLNEVYERYFSLLVEASQSGLFDVMAHPDLIKKFGFVPKRDLRPLYEETARAFKRADVCAEINTAGLRYPAKEIYPARPLLEAFYAHGVPVTLGSDAHAPLQVGEAVEKALALAVEVGYRELAVFERRARKMVKIS